MNSSIILNSNIEQMKGLNTNRWEFKPKKFSKNWQSKRRRIKENYPVWSFKSKVKKVKAKQSLIKIINLIRKLTFKCLLKLMNIISMILNLFLSMSLRKRKSDIILLFNSKKLNTKIKKFMNWKNKLESYRKCWLKFKRIKLN